MIKHRVSLKGPGATGAQISGFLLKELLDVLCDGTKGALRLRLEGRSSAPGKDPRWLEDASDFLVTGIEDGSTVLTIETKPLSEAVPDRFQQLSILNDHTSSAFKIFEESLDEAIGGFENSDLFDEYLLKTYARFKDILQNHGFDSVEIKNGKPGASSLTVGALQVETINALRRSTPKPQAVRLSGRLETIRYSDKMFELVTQTGEKHRGVAPLTWTSEEMARLFGTDVTVDGTAVYRPSGCLLRIEASSIIPAKPNDLKFWSEIPAPGKLRDRMRTLRQPQTSNSGLNKLWGRWPGDETDEQITEALQSL